MQLLSVYRHELYRENQKGIDKVYSYSVMCDDLKRLKEHLELKSKRNRNEQ